MMIVTIGSYSTLCETVSEIVGLRRFRLEFRVILSGFGKLQ